MRHLDRLQVKLEERCISYLSNDAKDAGFSFAVTRGFSNRSLFWALGRVLRRIQQRQSSSLISFDSCELHFVSYGVTTWVDYLGSEK
jgi:hypothetical protein